MISDETICGVCSFHRIVFRRCVGCLPILPEYFGNLGQSRLSSQSAALPDHRYRLQTKLRRGFCPRPLASTDYVPNLHQNAPRIIQKVMSYILDNFKDTVSLSEAAEIAGMGESSFSRFFKKNSGNNFVDYVKLLSKN